MKLVKVLDWRRIYERDGVKLPSQSFRLYGDNGHYVTIKPSFETNKRDWFSLSQMVVDSIELDENGNPKSSEK